MLNPVLWIRIYWFRVRIRIRIQQFKWIRVRFQIRIQGFDDQKLKKKNYVWKFLKYLFDQNLKFTYP
jgi:hypothetical protein